MAMLLSDVSNNSFDLAGVAGDVVDANAISLICKAASYGFATTISVSLSMLLLAPSRRILGLTCLELNQ